MNMNMMPFVGGFGNHTTGPFAGPECHMMPSTSMYSNFPAWWSSWSMPSSMPFEHSTTGFAGDSPRMHNFPSTWNKWNMPSMTFPSNHFESMPSMNMHHEMPHHMNMMPSHMNMPSHMMPSNMMTPHFPMWSNKNEVELRNVPVRPCNWNEYYSMSHPIKFDHFGNRCFSIGFDMHSYKPEEIKVTIKAGKWIVIEATMEEKADPKAAELAKSPEQWMNVSWLSNAKGCVKRTYYREVALPEEFKAENIKCFMTGHGWLCFECPMSTSTTCPTMSMSSMSSHPMSHQYMSKMHHMMPHHMAHHEVTFPINVTKC